jgi:FMN phosphatase YigB (HAD superfamily)
MPVLLSDLASFVSGISLGRVHARLCEANGGRLALADPDQLRDSEFDAFVAGRIGEAEYALHLRARLGWRGTDPDLVAIFADLYGSIDIAVMELLVELRARHWHLVALGEPGGHTPAGRRARWGGEYAEQLSVFDRVIDYPADLPRDSRGEVIKADPRFFAFLLRDTDPGYGPRLYVDDRPENVAAARRSGLDAHLFRGASGLRSACVAFTVGV